MPRVYGQVYIGYNCHMKTKHTTTIEIAPQELTKLLKEKLNLPVDAKVRYEIGYDSANDYRDMGPGTPKLEAIKITFDTETDL